MPYIYTLLCLVAILANIHKCLQCLKAAYLCTIYDKITEDQKSSDTSERERARDSRTTGQHDSMTGRGQTDRRQDTWTTREREKKNRRTRAAPADHEHNEHDEQRKEDNAPGKEEQKTLHIFQPWKTRDKMTAVFLHLAMFRRFTTPWRLTPTKQKQTAPARSAIRPRSDTKKAATYKNVRLSSNTRVRTWLLYSMLFFKCRL